MKILVTGGHGMLGSAIQKVFSTHELVLPEKSALDVTNNLKIKKFENKKIDIIFHCAALTDLQKAEENFNLAKKINTIGTKNMLELAQGLDVAIVFISSAMVFNGKKGQYTERHNPSPINNYGKTKFLAEKIIKTYKKHYIVRNGWSFGGGPSLDKKFINKIYQQIKMGKKRLYGITDIYGNPTYTNDFAKTIKNIVEKKAPFGTYNAAGKGVASRFEVLKTFVEYLGSHKKVEVVPVTHKEYSSLFPNPFPFIKKEVLDIKKIEKINLSSLRDWRVSLQEYSKEFRV